MSYNVPLTLVLSLVPGLSQLYLGRPKKAAGLLIVTTGITLSLIFSDSYLMVLIMCNIYLFTSVPAGVESYQIARYGRNTIDTSSRWYVVILLLTTGFTALPLLWNSGNFSKKAKITWSIAVPVLAAVFFTVLIRYWNALEALLRECVATLSGALSGLE